MVECKDIRFIDLKSSKILGRDLPQEYMNTK